MTRTSSANLDKAIGIVAIIFGILILLGEITVGWLVPLLGIILVVAGVLVLANVLSGSTAMGVAFLALGILLLVDVLWIPSVLARVIDLVVGAALIVIGILKLT